MGMGKTRTILGEAAPAPALHLADAREDGHQTSHLRSHRRGVTNLQKKWSVNLWLIYRESMVND